MLTRDQIRSAIAPRIDRFVDDLVVVLHRHLTVDVAEARALVVARLEAALSLDVAPPQNKRTKKAPRRCGLCREAGHTARICDSANGVSNGTKPTKPSSETANGAPKTKPSSETANAAPKTKTKKDRFAQIEERARRREAIQERST